MRQATPDGTRPSARATRESNGLAIAEAPRGDLVDARGRRAPFERPAIHWEPFGMLPGPLARPMVQRVVLAHRHLVPRDDLEHLIQETDDPWSRVKPDHAYHRL